MPIYSKRENKTRFENMFYRGTLLERNVSKMTINMIDIFQLQKEGHREEEARNDTNEDDENCNSETYKIAAFILGILSCSLCLIHIFVYF